MSDVSVFFKIGLIIHGESAEVWLGEESVAALFKKHERVKNSVGSKYQDKAPFVVDDKFGRRMSIDMQQVSFIMVLE